MAKRMERLGCGLLIMSVFAVMLAVQPRCGAQDSAFNPDANFYAPMIDPALYAGGVQTAIIQSVHFNCPRPNGFVVNYNFDNCVFAKDGAPYVQAYFPPRRLVPAEGDHFRQAKIALAEYCQTSDYLDDMAKAARLPASAEPVGAKVIQNTPTSIIVLTETRPQDGHATIQVLHGYFTIGSSLFEFACAATANTQPSGAAMFVSWLEQVLRNNR